MLGHQYDPLHIRRIIDNRDAEESMREFGQIFADLRQILEVNPPNGKFPPIMEKYLKVLVTEGYRYLFLSGKISWKNPRLVEYLWTAITIQVTLMYEYNTICGVNVLRELMESTDSEFLKAYIPLGRIEEPLKGFLYYMYKCSGRFQEDYWDAVRGVYVREARGPELVAVLLAFNGFFRVAISQLSNSTSFDRYDNIVDIVAQSWKYFNRKYKNVIVDMFCVSFRNFATHDARFQSVTGVKILLMLIRMSDDRVLNNALQKLFVTPFETMAQNSATLREVMMLIIDFKEGLPMWLAKIIAKFLGTIAQECPDMFVNMRSFVPEFAEVIGSVQLYEHIKNHVGILTALTFKDLASMNMEIWTDITERHPVTDDNANMMLSVSYLMKDDEARCQKVIKDLLSTNNAMMIDRMRNDYANDETYRKCICGAVENIDTNAVDIFVLLDLFKDIGIQEINSASVVEKLFMEKNAYEIIHFLKTYPFIKITDVQMLFEFTPHNSDLYTILDEQCLDSISEITNELLELEESSQLFYKLLVDSFVVTGDRRFIWKAGSFNPSEEVIAKLAADPTNLVSEIISAFRVYKQRIIPVVRALVDVSFKDVDVDKDCVDLYAYAVARGKVATREELISLLRSESSFAQEIALCEIMKQNIEITSDILRDVLFVCCEHNIVELIEKLGSMLTSLSIDEELISKCLVNTNKELAKLVYSFIGQSRIDRELLKSVLVSRNLLVVSGVFNNDEKICAMKDMVARGLVSREFAEFEDFLASIVVPDEASVDLIWQYFFGAEFPSYLRNSSTVSVLYRWMMDNNKDRLLDYINKAAEMCDSCKAAATSSLIFDALSGIDALFETENEEIVNQLTQLRFSTKSEVPNPFTRARDFDEVVRLLAPESRELFDVMEIDGTELIQTRVFDDTKSRDNIISCSECIVMSTNKSADEIEEKITINKAVFHIASVITDTAAYVKHHASWIKRTKNGNSEIVDHISGSVCMLFYQKKRNLEKVMQLSKLDDQHKFVIKSLHEGSIDWSVFQDESGNYPHEFIRWAYELISKFGLCEWMNVMVKSREFCDWLLTEHDLMKHVASFTDQIIAAASNASDPTTFAFCLIERAAEMPNLILQIYQVIDIDLTLAYDIFTEVINIPHFVNCSEFENYVIHTLSKCDCCDESILYSELILTTVIRSGNRSCIEKLLPLTSCPSKEIAIKCGSVDTIIFILSKQPNDIDLIFLAIPYVYQRKEIMDILKSMNNYDAMRKDDKWIVPLLSSDVRRVREITVDLLYRVWPPESECVDSCVGRVLATVLENTERWDEIIPLCIKYSQWFGGSGRVANMIVSYITSHQPHKIPFINQLLKALTLLPRPSVDRSYGLIWMSPMTHDPVIDEASEFDKRTMFNMLLRIAYHDPNILIRMISHLELNPFYFMIVYGCSKSEVEEVMSHIFKKFIDTPVQVCFVLLRLLKFVSPQVAQFIADVSKKPGILAKENWPLFINAIIGSLVSCQKEDKMRTIVSSWYSVDDIEDSIEAIMDVANYILESVFDSDSVHTENSANMITRLLVFNDNALNIPKSLTKPSCHIKFLKMMKNLCIRFTYVNVSLAKFYCKNSIVCFNSCDRDVRLASSEFVVDMFNFALLFGQDQIRAYQYPNMSTELLKFWGSVLFRELRFTLGLPGIEYSAVLPYVNVITSMLKDNMNNLRSSTIKRMKQAPEIFLLVAGNVAKAEIMKLNIFIRTLLTHLKDGVNLQCVPKAISKLTLSMPCFAERLKCLKQLFKQSKTNGADITSCITESIYYIEKLVDEDNNQTPELSDLFDEMIVYLAV